ncbi:hypothetical protein STENM327S_07259 [Streptomyces tendae]
MRALRRVGLRGVLQAGSAGLAADGDDVLTIGDVPHALLFPAPGRGGPPCRGRHLRRRAACRSARGPVPVTADQPFWATRLAALGAATDPIPFRALTAERLADLFSTRVVKQQAHNRAAASAAKRLAAENGAGQTLKTIQQMTDG